MMDAGTIEVMFGSQFGDVNRAVRGGAAGMLHASAFEFDEDAHPRDETGKFTSGGGDDNRETPPSDDPYYGPAVRRLQGE